MRAIVATLLLVAALCAAQMRPETYEMLERVQDLMAEQRYEEAAKRLEEADSRLERRPYDHAFVLHTHAYVFLAQDRYEEAAEKFEAALKLEALPKETTAGTLIALAQSWLLLDRPQKSVETLKRWRQMEGVTHQPAGFVLLASAHLELEQYHEAYGPLQEGIARSEDPPESWQATLASLALELARYEEAVALYGALLDRYGPDRGRYWMGIASAYLMQERAALALDALEAALHAGVLERTHYGQLWHLQMDRGVPMRAARLMEQALKEKRIEPSSDRFELLFHAYHLAREHRSALGALERAAALEPTADRFERMARAAMASAAYTIALDAAQRALEADPQEPGRLWLIKGSAHYERDAIAAALEAFERAAKEPESREQAERWIGFLRSL